MKQKIKYLIGIIVLLLGIFAGCAGMKEETGTLVQNSDREEMTEDTFSPEDSSEDETPEVVAVEIQESGEYTSKEEVAAYLHEFHHLPGNYITKKEAKELGWVSKEGNLSEVAPGKSIGGDYFGNYEGNLPEADGRDYYECDIDSDGGYRGAKRIVYSNDGLIYYTEDHYETFELLYGEE